MYTLQGKPNQHTTRLSRSVRVWSTTIRISRDPHIATFHTVINRFEQIHCTREEGLPTQSIARQPSNHRHAKKPKSSVEKSTPMDNWLLGLPGPYHRHAIGTFNTCSWGPTERSLIDTGGGYNLGGAGLPHTHSPTFPTSCLHFNHIFSQSLKRWGFKEPMAATWSFDHSAIYRSLHLRLVIANDLSLAEGVTRIDRKGVIMQLRYQFNSYHLMHIQET
jgi:hypothetical protein